MTFHRRRSKLTTATGIGLWRQSSNIGAILGSASDQTLLELRISTLFFLLFAVCYKKGANEKCCIANPNSGQTLNMFGRFIGLDYVSFFSIIHMG